MKIIALNIHNYERIKCVEIRPNGAPVVKLGGKNGSGKSSAINAIQAGLRGAVGRSAVPVHRGASQADVVCEFDGLTVHSVIEADGAAVLEVKDAKGRVKSPQTFLDQLVGRSKLFSDPLAFLNMDGHQQLDVLKRIVGLDLSALDAKRDELYKERENAGRDRTSRKNQIDSMPEYPEVPKQEQSSQAVVAEIQEAMRTNDANRKAREQAEAVAGDNKSLAEGIKNSEDQLSAWQKAERDLGDKAGKQGDAADDLLAQAAVLQDIDTAGIEAKIAALQKQLREAHATNAANKDKRLALEQAKSELASLTDKHAEATRTITKWQEKIAKDKANLDTRRTAAAQLATEATRLADVDVSALEAKLHNIEAVNKKVQANASRRQLRDQFDECKAQYDDLTEKLDEIDREKAKQLREAPFPVPELSFGLQGVLYKGLPFEQASQAEKLRISTAIALSLLPKDGIRLLLVRDASLLDEDSLKVMTDLAENGDVQLWLEIVTTDPTEATVILEDGAVKATAPLLVEAK